MNETMKLILNDPFYFRNFLFGEECNAKSHKLLQQHDVKGQTSFIWVKHPQNNNFIHLIFN